MSEIQTSSEALPLHTDLDKFVTQIWQHPLLTEQTRTMRQEAFDYVNSKYEGKSDLLLVPVGSSIWISGDKSDVDFVLLHHGKNEEVHEIEEFLNENRSNKNPLKPTLHLAAEYPISGQFNFERDIEQLAQLFLTPDEYITGDHEWLKQLRKKSLTLNNYDGTESSYIHSNFQSQFQHRVDLQLKKIKQWPSKSFANPYASYFPRFLNALFERAHHTQNPQNYTNLFYRNLSQLSPPDYEKMSRSIQASNGEIHIDPRYVAQGL